MFCLCLHLLQQWTSLATWPWAGWLLILYSQYHKWLSDFNSFLDNIQGNGFIILQCGISGKNLFFSFPPASLPALPSSSFRIQTSEFGSTCQSTSIFWQLLFLPALRSLTCKTSPLQDKVQKLPMQSEPEWRNVLPNKTCSCLDGPRFSQRPFLLCLSPISKRNLWAYREDQGKNQEDAIRRSVASR